MYYLHDKEAQTSDRVVWTQTRNMPTNDPEVATKWMAHTAINANRLKHDAGIPLTGRKRQKGVVYTFSLSWSPDENPDKEVMLDSADETLELLGLKEHQSLIVAHNDTEHPHVHVICNLINPNDGRMHDPDWGSKLKMSEWALNHELENEKIYCEQRVENNEKRKRGERVKYQEPIHERKAEIQKLYSQSDNGSAFRAALEEKGYTLAKGNRRRFVLVDDYGRIHSLSRQLNQEQRSYHLEKLSDILHQDLPVAKDIAAERNNFDRDKQEREQLQRMEDAAVEKAKQEQEAKKQAKSPTKKGQTQKVAGETKSKASKNSHRKLPVMDDKKHLQRLDIEQAWDREAFIKRTALERKLKDVYGREELVKTIEAYERQLQRHDTPWGRKSGIYKELSEKILSQKLTLENIDMRIAEERSKLENELSKTSPYTNKDQGGGQDLNHTPTIDFERTRNQGEGSEKKRPSQDHDDRSCNLDRL